MSGDESFDTCMSLICHKNNEPVSHEWFDSETRFDAEAKDNLEIIAYYHLHRCQYVCNARYHIRSAEKAGLS